MNNINEVRKASEIGYEGHGFYKYVACSSCGLQRWVRVIDLQNGKGLVCRSCGYKSTQTHNAKIEKLVSSGAKKASEIGKPVFSKRDPWYYPHTCSSCGKLVYHQRKDLYRVCKECAYIIRKTKSGNEHPNWTGGRYISGGYAIIKVDANSKYYPMTHATGYMLEHRLVVAMKIGRCLEDHEVVHHIDGNKLNNSPDNLELLTSNAEHLPYIRLQQRIYRLEEEVRLLRWQVKNLQQANPDLAETIKSQARVETLQELSYINGEDKEKVHSYEKSQDE